MSVPIPLTVARRRFDIRGMVQGVGFRPFVFRLAHAHELTGKVWNDSHGVTIECQGWPHALNNFARALHAELPPLARIDACEQSELPPLTGEAQFLILNSQRPATAGPDSMAAEALMDAAITIDSAVCPDCLREMRDPSDRRHGHALINCTNCGPRFSILREVPYDRQNTTMTAFPMCPECAAEYRNPHNRRFHAQPVCCPRCGPQLKLVALSAGSPPAVRSLPGDPIMTASRLLLEGKILAIKGIGGFHLAVRADWETAVTRLRSLKKRDAKPFALMTQTLAAAADLVSLSPAAQRAIAAPAAPIVLAPRMANAHVAAAVAPGTHLLGVMLPYTPIHHLLFDAFAALSPGAIPPLVMTSGNVSSEPLVIDNAEALERLGPLCDALLLHDRPIERPVDDSVLLDIGNGSHPSLPPLMPVRRSRGYAPAATPLTEALAAHPHPTGLCLGGELKNTIAVFRQRDIIVSQHLGDLSHPLAFEHFQKAIADLVRLLDVRIDFIAHDLHPGYMSTQAARQLAAQHHAPLIAIQHHHAHAAAVMAEHNLHGPALALACDGTGYGPDGTIWGGELLLIDGGNYRRVGRLKPMRLPGGDSAARDPRRSGLALLSAVYGEGFADLPAARRLFPEDGERRFLAHMITRGISSPWTSSTGRLFDAVAALLDICSHNAHEAQAAMALEAAAAGAWGIGLPESDESGPGGAAVQWNPQACLWELDAAKLVRSLLSGRERGDPVARLAAEFHWELARGLVGLAAKIREVENVDLLVASGGVFCNAHLTAVVAQSAKLKAFRAFFHKSYPPTDGGVALGQAAVVAERLLTSSP